MSIRIGLIGCGAISELFYSPALLALADKDWLKVSDLVDPDLTRLANVGKNFAFASQHQTLEHAHLSSLDLAIVASPQRFHAEQVITLLRGGVHVLCEKPLASTLEEAHRMVSVAEDCNRLLAVGLFRRFWPLTHFIHDLISSADLGRPLRFGWAEGGVFNWPAATPSFFQKSASSGGVFADLGAHVLDLLLHWFGSVASFDYQDDAMGGLENNALLDLCFVNGVSGQLRLSRDTPIVNTAWVEFERGTVTFQPGTVGEVKLNFKGNTLTAFASLQPALSYGQCFSAQIHNVCQAIRGEVPLRVPASAALPSMALIDQCYASRRLLEQPWLTPGEQISAQALTR